MATIRKTSVIVLYFAGKGQVKYFLPKFHLRQLIMFFEKMTRMVAKGFI